MPFALIIPFLDADFIHHVFIKEISSFIDANYIETEHISANVVYLNMNLFRQ